MNTPICDFVREYAGSGVSRLHMPGHKGAAILGPEPFDITEVHGADSLYEASGIILESEKNASLLFGTAKTCYSTEGSSQCIRAMLALATQYGKKGKTILAARNVHRSFLTAAALLDLKVEWLWPQTDAFSLCACPVSREQVRCRLAELSAQGRLPAAVYLTSPDYLGGMQDIGGIAGAAHAFGVPLLVDNAHGAYLHLLPDPCHPMDLGADLCCDSAHKTLPALTGCAYLHIGKHAPAEFCENARRAMALFGSTSPSYLLLQSLDRVNAELSAGWGQRLAGTVKALEELKQRLLAAGCSFYASEPLKLTVASTAGGLKGTALGAHLRSRGIEPEYADPDHLVLMFSPENTAEDLKRLENALLCTPSALGESKKKLSCIRAEQVLSIREAMLAESEILPACESVGRVLGESAIACPPAVPILVCGERISEESLPLFEHYGITELRVVK